MWATRHQKFQASRCLTATNESAKFVVCPYSFISTGTLLPGNLP